MSEADRFERQKTLIEKLRNQVRDLEAERNPLRERLAALEKEVVGLRDRVKQSVLLKEVAGRPDSETVVAALQKKIDALSDAISKAEKDKIDLAGRLKEKDDNNARIGNLCNILLRDKSSLMDANRQLYENISKLQESIQALEKANIDLQERVAQTISSLDLKKNF